MDRNGHDGHKLLYTLYQLFDTLVNMPESVESNG